MTYRADVRDGLVRQNLPCGRRSAGPGRRRRGVTADGTAGADDGLSSGSLPSHLRSVEWTREDRSADNRVGVSGESSDACPRWHGQGRADTRRSRRARRDAGRFVAIVVNGCFGTIRFLRRPSRFHRSSPHYQSADTRAITSVSVRRMPAVISGRRGLARMEENFPAINFKRAA